MKVLSLFDGMACGYIAMKAANVRVCVYDAYEIDKYAIQTATHNFPFIKEHGDVFQADFTQYEGYDYLIGGSPCTHWSIAQTKDRETSVSRDDKGQILLHSSGIGFELFSQFLRALEEAKPKYFLYENNKSMSNNIRQAITECFGFEPICINSSLVSAQTRQRLYWVGKRNEDGSYSKVDVVQPEDKGILLKDVLDCSEEVQFLSEREMDYMVRDHQDQRWSFLNRPSEKDKSSCVVANFSKGVPYNLCAEPIRIGTYPNDSKHQDFDSQQYRIYSIDGKSVTLCGNGVGMGAKTGLYAVPVSEPKGTIPVYEVKNREINIKGSLYPIKLKDGYYIIRKLTVSECKRLQTVPEWYEFPVSNSQAYKMLGNGWTCDVIAHILSFTLKKEDEEKKMELKVNAVQLPEQALTFNYEELKSELLKKAEFYASLVYTEEQIKEAKADRANLNRLKKALNDERINMEKEYMQPFMDFMSKITEIIGIIDKPCYEIDKQIKKFEEKQKAEKLEEIKRIAAEIAFPVSLDIVMDQKWLNASVSLKSIQESLESRKQSIMNDLSVIETLPFAFECKDLYLRHLDLSEAVRESNRLQELAERKAAEAEKAAQKEDVKQPETVNPAITPEEDQKTEEKPVERKWIGFQALLSVGEAAELGTFLRSRNIRYKAI